MSAADGKRGRRALRSRRTGGSALVALVLALIGCTASSTPHATLLTATRPAAAPRAVIAPYLYVDGARTPDPAAVMAHTGVRWFSLAFILSTGRCAPAWPEQSGLGGRAADLIRRIHRAGGHVVVSMGGAQGSKLGVHCPGPQTLAAAYQQVIDRYQLTAVDLDVEGAEFDDARVQDKIVRALRILGERNPGMKLSVTLPTTPDGLDRRGTRLIRRAADLGAPVDAWMIMPFNFGRGDTEMGRLAIQATERTHDQLRAVYPQLSDRAVYRRQGIVLMNGRTDTGEVVTPKDFRDVRVYAAQHHLARLSFWSLNRDGACSGKESLHTCSGVQQRRWEFADVLEVGRHHHPPAGPSPSS